jgi:hypothetical protein
MIYFIEDVIHKLVNMLFLKTVSQRFKNFM